MWQPWPIECGGLYVFPGQNSRTISALHYWVRSSQHGVGWSIKQLFIDAVEGWESPKPPEDKLSEQVMHHPATIIGAAWLEIDYRPVFGRAGEDCSRMSKALLCVFYPADMIAFAIAFYTLFCWHYYHSLNHNSDNHTGWALNNYIRLFSEDKDFSMQCYSQEVHIGIQLYWSILCISLASFWRQIRGNKSLRTSSYA